MIDQTSDEHPIYSKCINRYWCTFAKCLNTPYCRNYNPSHELIDLTRKIIQEGIERRKLPERVIYLIESKEYDHVCGLWTNVDKMTDWVLEQTYPWIEKSRKTNLQVFTARHRVVVFKDGNPEVRQYPEWSTLLWRGHDIT